MALGPSALSIAVDGIADAVVSHFQGLGETVTASVDTPLSASERAKGANANDCINLFFYRIAPSAFQPDHTAGDPFMLRLFCLVTPFPAKALNAADAGMDLKLLGETIRFFHGAPVLPTRPAAPAPLDTVYRLQAVLLAPNMEEINHIWTTQGSELPYRLSAAYEFALVPVEPTVRRLPGPPVTSARLQVDASMDRAHDITTTPRTGFSGEARDLALPPPFGHPPLTIDWVPELLIVVDETLVNTAHVPAAATTLRLAIAGRPGGRARLTMAWFTATGVAVGAATQTVRNVATGRMGSPGAGFDLAVTKPATGVILRITAAAARPNGTAIAGALRSAMVEAIFDGT